MAKQVSDDEVEQGPSTIPVTEDCSAPPPPKPQTSR